MNQKIYSNNKDKNEINNNENEYENLINILKEISSNSLKNLNQVFQIMLLFYLDMKSLGFHQIKK